MSDMTAIKKRNRYLEQRLSEEDAAKYEHTKKRALESAEKLKKDMIGHLSALDDGVIAIFITVMMLEIPYPTSRTEYHSFVWSVLVFFVSFFIVADFWYENKKIFSSLREADHLTVVMNFIFLAVLALIPATTKWILNRVDRYAAMHFGIVYFVASLCQELLMYAALRKRFTGHKNLFFRMAISRAAMLVVMVAVLLVLSYFYPRIAIIFYVILPIWSFFRPDRRMSGGDDASVNDVE